MKSSDSDVSDRRGPAPDRAVRGDPAADAARAGAPAGADAVAGRARRRGARLAVAAAVAVLAALLGWLAVTGRPITLPAGLAAQVETRLNAALGGARLKLRSVVVQIVPNGLPRVTLRGVELFDAHGQPLAQIGEMRARVSGRALLLGRIEPRRLTLSGGEITVRRRGDGTFDLALGGGLQASGTLTSILDGIDRAFAAPPLAGVTRILAEDLTISLEDARSGRVWQVTGGQVQITQDAQVIDLSLSAEIFNGTEQLAPAVLGFRSQKGSSAARLTARFENAAAADIAAQTPALAFLAPLEAPISGVLTTVIDGDGTLSTIAGKLAIAAGRLQAGGGVAPVAFDGAQLYFDYDAEHRRIDFSEARLDTSVARVRASGHAYLEDLGAGGWPGALLGQFRTSELVLAPEGVFEAPVAIDAAIADLRLKLAPFSLEIGQLALVDGASRGLVRGRIAAGAEGWSAEIDLSVNRIAPGRLLQLWPVSLGERARRWLRNNVRSALVHDVAGAVRWQAGRTPRSSISYRFRDGEVQILRTLPPARGVMGYASLLDRTLTMVIEEGRLEAPSGGAIDVAGTVFRIPDTAARPARAEVALSIDGGLPDILSVLDLEPFRFLARAGRSPDLVAGGHGRASAALSFDLGRQVRPEEVRFTVEGEARDVVSDTLVPGRRFRAAALTIRADNDRLEIAGAAELDRARFRGAWVQKLGREGAGRSLVEGTVVLDRALLDSFGILLPPGAVEGEGLGQFQLDLVRGEPPRFSLVSDLNRLAMRLDALGWSKPANRTGELTMTGRLGEAPEVESLRLRAAGLTLEGMVRMRTGGGLEVARFTRLGVGGWLDAAVTLTGRGDGRPPVLSFEGGTLDTRRARFVSGGLGGGGGGGGGPGQGQEQGESAPVQVALDRVILSEGISLTDLTGRFASGRSLSGRFTARVNGGTAISGRVVPQGTGLAFDVRSSDAGGVMRDAGILAHARGGAMRLALVPTGEDGVYDGALEVQDTRMVGAPTLAALLNAVSVVGLVDQLNNEGLRFTEVTADFRLTPDQLRLFRASAVGPSAGISLDGVYDLASRQLDLQGVLSPLYLLNSVGQMFTRRGEGVFGVTFTIEGPAQAPRVAVNPLSMLAPGFLREIFRRPAPQRRTPIAGSE